MCQQFFPRRPSRSTCLLILLALVIGWSADAVRADEAFLANNAITAPDATIFRTQINTYVAAEIKHLQSDDPNVQKAAKDDLIRKVDPDLQPTPSFLSEYADELNQQLAPLAKNKSLRVQLNAAVVNASVAQQAGNAKQVDATLAFMQDPQEPIALWGLKAATYEIPQLIQIPAGVRNDKLTPAVLPAVKAHPDSGPIVEEAYKALTLDTAGNNFVNLAANQVQDATGPVLDLFTYRVGQYASKSPTDPLAENLATLFLTREKVWSAQTPKQQRSTLDQMYKLCSACATLELNADSQKDDLVSLLRQTGRAFGVVGTILDDKNLPSDGDEVSKITGNTPSTQVQQSLQKLQGDIQSVQLNGGVGTASNAGASSNAGTASNGGASPPP